MIANLPEVVLLDGGAEFAESSLHDAETAQISRLEISLLGAFQLGIYAGMTMYFPRSVVVGPGAAFVFLLYAIQVLWTIVSAAGFLVGNRKALRALEEAEGVLPAPADAT